MSGIFRTHPRTHMNRHIFCLLTPVMLLIAGCANPGVVKLSPDTYMLSKADHAGIFGNVGKLKASVIEEANKFAESQGKIAIPIASRETPNAPGHFATFEYQFRVVDANDPEARRTALVPQADITIDRTDKISVDVTDKTPKAEKADIYVELTKLDELRKKGILTQEEFDAEKKRLLSNH